MFKQKELKFLRPFSNITPMVKVKICGITNIDDALTAVGFGADMLGFVFAESPRRISPEKARDIVKDVPPHIVTVGLFVNEDAQRVREITAAAGLRAIQLHGDESPEYVSGFSPDALQVLKAFRVSGRDDLASINQYQCDAILLDTKVEGVAGGSGEVFEWEILEDTSFSRPVILAGGLTPDNVAQAVERVHPYAVDVSSGVECSPGRKDKELLRRFISNAKGLT